MPKLSKMLGYNPEQMKDLKAKLKSGEYKMQITMKPLTPEENEEERLSVKRFLERDPQQVSPEPNKKSGMKFITALLLVAVNTIVITVARSSDFFLFWVLGADLLLFLAISAWKNWSHPVTQLGNQAAYMNWIYLKTNKDDGFRNTVVKKNNVVALISYQKKCVFIIEPFQAGPFKDFIEVDRWLETKKRTSASTEEGHDDGKG